MEKVRGPHKHRCATSKVQYTIIAGQLGREVLVRLGQVLWTFYSLLHLTLRAYLKYYKYVLPTSLGLMIFNDRYADRHRAQNMME